VAHVCAGGAGRFLILHLPGRRQLAIFDVNEAKIVKYLAVAEDNIKFAASQDKLVVANPTAKGLQRFNLAGFEKQATVAMPTEGKLAVALMGSASPGPLMLAGSSLTFLDPVTFKEVKYQWEEGRGGRAMGGINDNYPASVRLSANGL